MSVPPKGFGVPLASEDATVRVTQLLALGDPDRVLLLSHLARETTPQSVEDCAAVLDLDTGIVTDHLNILFQSELVTLTPGRGGPRFSPAPDALIRFGRLVSVPMNRDSHGSAAQVPLERLVDRLAYRFESIFSRETIERYVHESHDLLAQRATVTQHLTVLTSKFATDRLAALAVAQGHRRGVPEVLFVCTQNAGRSQMAAAFLRRISGQQVHVRSAGTTPGGSINPVVVEALAEVGIPLLVEFPKPLTDEVVMAADVVVTLGCGDACPVHAGKRYIDWVIEDPQGMALSDVRTIRDNLYSRVRQLVAELGITPEWEMPAAGQQPTT
ncbi:three-helix bundle dimerization domain-containing protein [Aestuariimicrobium sp. Y1814]|uniref:arsenate reductase/protein-tyrosine-phosphatase family protein n=1 Tax=Aestuariimicrobium sp. Y1814 TaxID=3418742 RepID=UPI003DA7010B